MGRARGRAGTGRGIKGAAPDKFFRIFEIVAAQGLAHAERRKNAENPLFRPQVIHVFG